MLTKMLTLQKDFTVFWRALKLARWGEWNIIRRKSTVKCDVKRFRCF